MIVERFTYKVKIGCEAEVVKLVKAMVEEAGLTPRVCTFTYGPREIVTSDLEFETEEDKKEFWKDLDWSAPAAAEVGKKATDLVESHWKDLLQVH